MKNIIIHEITPDFLIQGLGLSQNDGKVLGKIGRHEVELHHSGDGVAAGDEILVVGQIEAGQFRPGDVLMVGSDELLDRAFQTLDEMEQRGVVVSLTPTDDPNHVFVDKAEVLQYVNAWKENGAPHLCLFMAMPVESDGQAKLVNLVRKILS